MTMDCSGKNLVEEVEVPPVDRRKKTKWETIVSSSLHTDQELKKLKRTVKPLPSELENIGPHDLTHIHCAVEVYTKGKEMLEHNVAQYVKVDVCNDGVTTCKRIHLQKDLNLCQLRRFCRRLGIKQTANSNKDACRRALLF